MILWAQIHKSTNGFNGENGNEKAIRAESSPLKKWCLHALGGKTFFSFFVTYMFSRRLCFGYYSLLLLRPDFLFWAKGKSYRPWLCSPSLRPRACKWSRGERSPLYIDIFSIFGDLSACVQAPPQKVTLFSIFRSLVLYETPKSKTN